MELWATSLYDLKLTEKEFWYLDVTRYNSLVARRDEHVKQEDYRYGLIVCTIGNMFRDSKHPPLTPATFFPSLEEDEREARKNNRMHPDQIKEVLKLHFAQLEHFKDKQQ